MYPGKIITLNSDLSLDVPLVREINQGYMAYVSLSIPLIWGVKVLHCYPCRHCLLNRLQNQLKELLPLHRVCWTKLTETILPPWTNKRSWNSNMVHLSGRIPLWEVELANIKILNTESFLHRTNSLDLTALPCNALFIVHALMTINIGIAENPCHIVGFLWYLNSTNFTNLWNSSPWKNWPKILIIWNLAGSIGSRELFRLENFYSLMWGILTPMYRYFRE